MNRTIEVEVDQFGRKFYFTAQVEIKEVEGEKWSLSVPDALELVEVCVFDVILETGTNGDVITVFKNNCTEKTHPMTYKLLIETLQDHWMEYLSEIVLTN